MTIATRRPTGEPPTTGPVSGGPIVVLDARVVRGSGGGPDKTILNSPRFLDGSGYRMLCAYMHPPGDPGFEHLRRRAELWGAPLLAVPDRGPWDVRVVSRLAEICRRERVAIWHGHDYKSNALGLLLRRFRPMRLVTTVHGWVHRTRRTPLYYGIDRLALRAYERVICVSEDLRARCLEGGVPAGRCLLVENGIDPGQFARTLDVGEAKRRLGLAPGRLLIGAAGRLSAEKGFDLLIRAVDRLLDRGLDLELRIAGEGDERDRLAGLIRRLGREARIHLVGFQPEMAPFFEAMDIFALSSHREGLPNVLLEAMAMGVPVVATRVAGVPDLVRDREGGLLVEPGAVGPLADAIALLSADPGLRSGLGAGGREAARRRFGFDVRMARIRAIYDELLEPGGPTATPQSGALAP